MKTTSSTPASDTQGESSSSVTSTLYWAPRFGTYVKELYESPGMNGTSTTTGDLVKFTPGN